MSSSLLLHFLLHAHIFNQEALIQNHGRVNPNSIFTAVYPLNGLELCLGGLVTFLSFLNGRKLKSPPSVSIVRVQCIFQQLRCTTFCGSSTEQIRCIWNNRSTQRSKRDGVEYM